MRDIFCAAPGSAGGLGAGRGAKKAASVEAIESVDCVDALCTKILGDGLRFEMVESVWCSLVSVEV